jgi:glycerophosphoryl diester phosphodiesterase
MTSTHPFFDHDGPLALAHQGGADEAVENSTEAFANAHRIGYRYLDIDLQVTKDDVVVAHHDDTLDRLTGFSGTVAERSWAELSEARLPNGEPLARFDDLCDAHPDANWNIELKTDHAIGATVDLIRRRGLGPRVCFSTFSDRRMWKLRRAVSGLGTSTSTPKYATLWLRISSFVSFVPYRTPAHVSQAPPVQTGITIIDERFVRRAHDAGVAICAWTIDEADEMRRLLDLGVDGINSDTPTTLKSVLEERGQWT